MLYTLAPRATLDAFASALEGVHQSEPQMAQMHRCHSCTEGQGEEMSSVELLYVTSMLTWTIAGQAALWRLVQHGQPALVGRAVRAAGRRRAGRRSA